MTTWLRRLSVAAGSVALLALGGFGGAAGTAHAAGPEAAGTAGYCPTDKGVTVVVDFNELGGGIVVRCAPDVGSGDSGIDALQGAGFTPEGVRRYGLAFVCRIAGKPAPDQQLPVHGDPGYQEECVNTPPATAFWGSWYAPNGGSWSYSQESALNRDVIPGGFEGWSFSLNHTEGSAPRPGVAPTRPKPPPTTPPTHRPPTHQPPTHQPPSHRPPTHQPTRPPTHGPTHPPTHPPSDPASTTTPARPTDPPSTSGGPSTDQASGGSGGAGTHRPPSSGGAVTSGGTTGPTNDLVSPTDPVEVGHNEAGEPVSGALPPSSGGDDGGGPSAGTVAAVLAFAALISGAAVVGWRRRVSRE